MSAHPISSMLENDPIEESPFSSIGILVSCVPPYLLSSMKIMSAELFLEQENCTRFAGIYVHLINYRLTCITVLNADS